MGKLLENSQSLVVQQVMELVRGTLESKLDAIVNLAYKQGYERGYNDCLTGKGAI